MRSGLSYLLFLQHTVAGVLSHEGLISQVESGSSSLRVDSSSLASSLTHPSEVQPPGPRHRHHHGDQLEAEKEQETGISKLNPYAKTFIPANHGRRKHYGHSTPQGSASALLPPNWDGAPTAFHQKHWLQHPYSQKPHTQLPLIISTEVLDRVSDGFPRVAELQTWFMHKVMHVGRLPHPDQPRVRRWRFLKQVMGYRWAYETFYAMPAIEGNRLLEEGFQDIYDFGRRFLNKYRTKDADRTEKLFNAFNSITRVFPASKSLEADELEKLLCWPIILAASREWFYREAAKFSNYLWTLRSTFPTASDHEALWNDCFKEGKNLEFESLMRFRKPHLQGIGKILGYEEKDGEMDEWWDYVKQICVSNNYHEVNLRIEQTMHGLLEKKNMVKDPDFWTSSPVVDYCHKWQLEKSTLTYLATIVEETSNSRGKDTMGYELSKDCLDHFSQNILKLVKQILKRHGIKDGSSETEASGQLLKRIYGPRPAPDSVPRFRTSGRDLQW